MTSSESIRKDFDSELASSTTLESLGKLSIKYLGRRGRINEALGELVDLPTKKRRAHGATLNRLKGDVEEAIREARLKVARSMSDQWFDVTLPGKKRPKGSLHIVTYAIEEIARIFERLGFVRMSYPEVEWEYFSFDALNMPPRHPARDDFETFFIDTPPHKKYGRMVLTPHTSSGQIREMQRSGNPPIKMINIAKTYRPNWDATHTPMFHQFEGLCIDQGIDITHLKGTIELFAKEYFGEEREIRLRPFHFQFTEPSFEVDITCDMCGGSGFIETESCRVCKSGWLELGGAGMVHPKVLKEGKIDPAKYTGWAFGFGVERVAMMKGGLKLDDLRILYSGDVRFLEQF